MDEAFPSLDGKPTNVPGNEPTGVPDSYEKAKGLQESDIRCKEDALLLSQEELRAAKQFHHHLTPLFALAECP